MPSYQNRPMKIYVYIEDNYLIVNFTFNQGNLADDLVRRGHALSSSFFFFFKLTFISRSLIL